METTAHSLRKLDGHMNTMTGKKFNIFDPHPDQIDILDISHGLAFKGHFCGQSPKFFSIAQHSLLTTHLCQSEFGSNKPEIALVALMHDAPEAYIGDMIKPIKVHFPKFTEIEDKIMSVIAVKFGLDINLMETIKKFDNGAQALEFDCFYRGYKIFEYLSPEDANSQFLTKFYELFNKCKGK